MLVNLLKYLNLNKYDVTLKTIFGTGPYVKDVPDGVKYSCVFKREFKGFNTMMKALPGRFWHWLFVRGHYDIEIAYLENSPTRIVAACPHKDTKKVGWVHIEFDERSTPCAGFRDEVEMVTAYNKLDRVVFVAQRTRENFVNLFPEIKVPVQVIHNVNDFDKDPGLDRYLDTSRKVTFNSDEEYFRREGREYPDDDEEIMTVGDLLSKRRGRLL